MLESELFSLWSWVEVSPVLILLWLLSGNLWDREENLELSFKSMPIWNILIFVIAAS